MVRLMTLLSFFFVSCAENAGQQASVPASTEQEPVYGTQAECAAIETKLASTEKDLLATEQTLLALQGSDNPAEVPKVLENKDIYLDQNAKVSGLRGDLDQCEGRANMSLTNSPGEDCREVVYFLGSKITEAQKLMDTWSQQMDQIAGQLQSGNYSPEAKDLLIDLIFSLASEAPSSFDQRMLAQLKKVCG